MSPRVWALRYSQGPNEGPVSYSNGMTWASLLKFDACVMASHPRHQSILFAHLVARH